jgi:cell division protein FtsQ
MAWNKEIWLKRLKQALIFSFWLGLVTALFVSLSFTNKEAEKLVCKQVDITLKNVEEQALVNREMILESASGVSSDSLFKGKLLTGLNIMSIENRINQNMLVKQADVFTDLNGILHIEVDQRLPILHVINLFGDHFYIDKDGLKMPCSPIYTPHVPVATGIISEAYDNKDSVQTFVLKGLIKIATYVDKDAFWKAQIEQIFVSNEAELVLVPKFGNHTILFGKVDDMEIKFEKLLVFYREALNKVGWNKYKVLDIRFNNQVVAKK